MFESEKEMVRPVIDWLRGEGYDVRSEFYLPWGVCDLVGIEVNEGKLINRLAAHQYRPIGAMLKIQLFDLLPNFGSDASLTPIQLQKKMGMRERVEDIEHALDSLKADGFAINLSRKNYQRINGWFPLQKKIVAVELKMHRVLFAHFQANLHWMFANQSFVALPRIRADRLLESDKRKLFEDTGVGVLAVTKDNCSAVLKSRPRNNSPDRVMQAHVVERFWTSMIKEHSA